MRYWIVFLAVCCLLAGGPVQAKEVGGVELPGTLHSAQGELALNGAGVRSKFFFHLYVGALYLKSPSSSGPAVVRADEPMGIRLRIVSSLITSKKMEEATREGFDKATGGKTSRIEERIDQFISVFKQDEIEKGDVFDLIYTPANGVEVEKNGNRLVDIPGLDFKQALFGIWLSGDPVQESLKEGMLGQDEG